SGQIKSSSLRGTARSRPQGEITMKRSIDFGLRHLPRPAAFLQNSIHWAGIVTQTVSGNLRNQLRHAGGDLRTATPQTRRREAFRKNCSDGYIQTRAQPYFSLLDELPNFVDSRLHAVVLRSSGENN